MSLQAARAAGGESGRTKDRPRSDLLRSSRTCSMRWPRPETALLAIALGATVLAKLAVIRGWTNEQVMPALLRAALPDVAFFAAVFAASLFARAWPWPRVVSRVSLLVASGILVWSLLDAGWLLATSAQLQPGVVEALARSPGDFWPTVENHLRGYVAWIVPLAAALLCGSAWLVWRVLRPVPLEGSARRVLASGAAAALFAIVALAGASWKGSDESLADSGVLIGFSSHWNAVRRAIDRAPEEPEPGARGRTVPRRGERGVTLPAAEAGDRPNVVIVMLESVSWSASLGAGEHVTPNLRRLAAEGVSFERTHVPVPVTTKAFWTTLTGAMPELREDTIETVPVERPYESIATILGSAGYRTAFFEMSRGSFQCAPGLFWNLGFDWAWFRENLGDESAHLGPFNGDDFRMIEPLLEWAEMGSAPFLLTLITSAAHQPYELPAWYEHDPSEDRGVRYGECVRFTDDFLGELWSRLVARGLAESTLLCVIGDHGDSCRPGLRNGRLVPFEEVLRVPWIIRYPERIEPGRRVEWPCSQLDVTPTLLSLLGGDVVRAGFDGRDALTPAPPDRRLGFSMWVEDAPIGFVEGMRKVVWWPYTDACLAYDLESDPGETAPRPIEGREKQTIVEGLSAWRAETLLDVPAPSGETIVYDHWRVWSEDHSAFAQFVPSGGSSGEGSGR